MPLLYDTKIVKYKGRQYRTTFPYDDDHPKPWVGDDGRGIVHSTSFHADKRPGWRPLPGYGDTAKWFDWAGTIKKAKEEDWGLSAKDRAALAAELGADPTPGQIIERAVQKEYDFLLAYMQNNWYYVGIEVTLLNEDGEPDESLQDTCWGFETWKDYHLEAAQGMVEELDVRVEKELAKRYADEARDARVREQARAGGCDLVILDDAGVREVGEGYWVVAELFVPKTS